ncbi:DUF523 domain-containing protein [Methylomarinum vadi]|uniref:DUF523 domain-containing protein n=1 Tax=Methylomarinum vadi TaxID=438855 RepID=UPI0004DF4B9F|nr:DUF523 domain-containing protein [Methylomarinum vadi]
MTSKLAQRLKRYAQRLGLVAKDCRSRRIVVMIECLLNQNARDDGAAVSPAMTEAVLELCRRYAAGIVQIPCPEMRALGFERSRPPGVSIRQALDTEPGRACCRQIGREIAERLQDYRRQGYDIVAVLGGNPESPGCAVHIKENGLTEQSGVMMQELFSELHNKGIVVSFRGMRDADPAWLAEDLAWLEALLRKAG